MSEKSKFYWRALTDSWSPCCSISMLVKSGAGDTDPGTDNLHTEDGGLRYEVVLEEARTKKMPRPKSAPSISRSNQQDIQSKLKVGKMSPEC